MRPSISDELYAAGVIPRASLTGGAGSCVGGEAVIMVKLPRIYSRPWRLSVETAGVTPAFTKENLPGVYVPADPYATTTRARLLVSTVGQAPIALDVPAQSGAFYFTSHDLEIGIIDPGPPSPAAVTTYRLWLDEADTAPDPSRLYTLTQAEWGNLGFGSEIDGIVPRNAVAVQVQPNNYTTAPVPTPPDPAQPSWLLRFYTGSRELLASYFVQGAGAPPPGTGLWTPQHPCPVPVGAVGFNLRNHGFGGVFQPPVMQFSIAL